MQAECKLQLSKYLFAGQIPHILSIESYRFDFGTTSLYMGDTSVGVGSAFNPPYIDDEQGFSVVTSLYMNSSRHLSSEIVE